MINLIYVHIGNDLPNYFWDTIEQARRFHTDNIYLIIPRKELKNINIEKYNCKSLAYEDLLNFEKNLSFEKLISYSIGTFNIGFKRMNNCL